MDPLEAILKCIWNLPNYLNGCAPEVKGIILMGIISVILLIFATLKGDPTNKGMDQEMNEWSSRCGILIQRIDTLMPIYEQTLMDYAHRAEENIGESMGIKNMAKGNPDQKDRAEFDVVTQDSGRYEDVAILRMRLEDLMKQEKA